MRAALTKWDAATAANHLRTRRRVGVAGLITAAILLLSILGDHLRAQNPFGDDWATFDNRQVRILRLTDAESITVRSDSSEDLTTIHLLGTRCFKTPWDKSLAADANSEFAGQTVTVHLNPTQTRDDRDRLLADAVLQDGKPLSVQLVAEGLSLADGRAPSAFIAAIERAETQARRRRLGIWRDIEIQTTRTKENQVPSVNKRT